MGRAMLVKNLGFLRLPLTEPTARPETKRALPLALYRCLKQPFLAAILPRLFLIVFKYSQPILIKESIRYVTTSYAITSSTYSYWIILSGIAIYVGLAVGLAHKECSLAC
jgi:ATP-binding cassette, subfamily C (CFTR/MRP), member 1